MADQSQSRPIYFGLFRHVLDKKHRITIPARWRSEGVEEEEFYIVPDQTGTFLQVMPPEEFRSVEELINKNEGPTRQERRIFIRWFYSSAQHCFSDKQGRLLLPEEPRKQVGLRDGTELTISGSLKRFEIWDSKRWDDAIKAGDPICKKVAELAGLL